VGPCYHHAYEIATLLRRHQSTLGEPKKWRNDPRIRDAARLHARGRGGLGRSPRLRSVLKIPDLRYGGR
jgi:hypothetical protein